jgi:hypothetical protein
LRAGRRSRSWAELCRSGMDVRRQDSSAFTGDLLCPLYVASGPGWRFGLGPLAARSGRPYRGDWVLTLLSRLQFRGIGLGSRRSIRPVERRASFRTPFGPRLPRSSSAATIGTQTICSSTSRSRSEVLTFKLVVRTSGGPHELGTPSLVSTYVAAYGFHFGIRRGALAGVEAGIGGLG